MSLSPVSIRTVALTREKGANDKLAALLPGIQWVEIPCIAFEPGPDVNKLENLLTDYDLIVITSPQAASVVLDVWKSKGKPQVKVISVGKGTSKPLIKEGITPVFEPSDATGVCLAKELPLELGRSILYPSSSLADNSLVKGLEDKGFKVDRINTYTTVPATWTDEQIDTAKGVDVVALASPSAVRTWAERIGTSAAAVVIGPTSAKAAEEAGFQRVYVPSEGSKGLEPWAKLIAEVINESA